MHTIIQPQNHRRHRLNAEKAAVASFRRPSYDCREQPDAVKLIVYVPGVDPAAVEIETSGPDVTITARKAHFVRVNWQALHRESAQRDYQLRLRLGHGPRPRPRQIILDRISEALGVSPDQLDDSSLGGHFH